MTADARCCRSAQTRRRPTERKAQIVRMLKTRPRTTAELAQAMGTTAQTTRRYLAELHDSTRIHVLDWLTAKGPRVSRTAALWAFGSGPDAPRPPAGACSDTVGDAIEAVYVSANQQRALDRAQTLASELRKLPADNPLQALVQATLHAGHGGEL